MAQGLNDPVIPSARVERRFFSIVRWCGLTVAVAALVAVAIAVLGGGSKLLDRPNTDMHPPTASYDEFRRTAVPSRQDDKPTNVDPTLKRAEEEAARAAAAAASEKRLKPLLDAIMGSLANYAAKVGQAKPDAQAIGDYVRQSMQEIARIGSDDLSWKYVEGLSTATRDLATDGERIAKLELSDPGRVRYPAFIEWHRKSYIEQIRAERQRVEAEKMRALVSLAEAPMFFYAAAIAFGIFVLGTMLLVLLRIEANTRPLMIASKDP